MWVIRKHNTLYQKHPGTYAAAYKPSYSWNLQSSEFWYYAGDCMRQHLNQQQLDTVNDDWNRWKSAALARCDDASSAQ
jgi:hypothetical protein